MTYPRPFGPHSIGARLVVVPVLSLLLAVILTVAPSLPARAQSIDETLRMVILPITSVTDDYKMPEGLFDAATDRLKNRIAQLPNYLIIGGQQEARIRQAMDVRPPPLEMTPMGMKAEMARAFRERSNPKSAGLKSAEAIDRAVASALGQETRIDTVLVPRVTAISVTGDVIQTPDVIDIFEGEIKATLEIRVVFIRGVGATRDIVGSTYQAEGATMLREVTYSKTLAQTLASIGVTFEQAVAGAVSEAVDRLELIFL